MNEPIKPHPQNVSGPFYVEYGCCTACDVPMSEAPGLFAYDSDYHCFVKRQPDTNEEVTNAIGAAWCAELQCIRYRGNDTDVLRRLAELDLRELCDVEPPARVEPLIRNHVTFATNVYSARRLAQRLRDYLTSLTVDSTREYEFRAIHETNINAVFEFAWYEEDFHVIRISSNAETDSHWHVWHPLVGRLSDRGACNILHSWICSDSIECDDVRWYVESDWYGTKRFQRTPW